MFTVDKDFFIIKEIRLSTKVKLILSETAGEVAFVPSIVIIPYIMQKKGRRVASLATVIPLLFSWLISFDTGFTSSIIFNVLHNISLGGAVTISSVIIAEFCTPKYRGTFLMLETAMISLGVLISHVLSTFSLWSVTSTLGLVIALYSALVVYFWPESPYWLMSQGHMVKATEIFQWLRGHDEDAYKELEAMMKAQKVKLLLEALRPIKKIHLKERTINYVKSLLKADFLRPLSIMILLFSFVGFGNESVSNYSIKDIFNLTNGKYIGTIVLDVLTLVCSLTACVLIQIVRRTTLFVITGSFSVICITLTCLLLFLRSLELFSTEFLWVFLSLVTGFVMFMSLGTSALPFTLLGEIFPMSYKGIGSSLTCAYLWAFGNTIIMLVPSLTERVGVHGTTFLFLILMIVILVILNKIMPETNTKTLLEIEDIMISEKNDYEIVNVTDQEEMENFDRLKLFIEV